jgi:hypothetical protein
MSALPPKADIRNGHVWRSSSGSFAIFAAILRASSRVSIGGRSPARLILEIDVRELLPVAVFHHKTGANILDRPKPRDSLSYCNQQCQWWEGQHGHENGNHPNL